MKSITKLDLQYTHRFYFISVEILDDLSTSIPSEIRETTRESDS